MGDTKIEWCQKVWNPVTGCTKVGAGCKHCYAERMFTRLAENPKAPKYQGRQFGDVMCHDDILYEPFHWKKPCEIFVTSMGDLFHEDVPDAFIEEVVRVIGFAKWHTFILLTKRPERMRGFFAGGAPRNLVLGVSCSTQTEADRWIPTLLETPAECRVVSLEPLLVSVDIEAYVHQGPPCYPSRQSYRRPSLSGVILGGESGPKARPMHPDCVRNLRDQCAAAGTPFFFKQWGEWAPQHNYGGFYYLTEEGKGALSLPDSVQKTLTMARVGKHRAGRILDRRTHDALPWRVGA